MKRQTIRIKVLPALFVLSGGTGHARNANGLCRLDGTTITTGALIQKINQLMDSAPVTSLGVTMFNEGELVYRRTFGSAN